MGSISPTPSPTGLSILITGGASGIGLGIVSHFASQPLPHHITVLDINSSSFPSIQSSLKSQYPKASIAFKHCDISSWDSQAARFKETYSSLGRIDIVLANAGISKDGVLIAKEGEEEAEEPVKPSLGTVDVNLIGTIYTVKLGIHYLRKNSPTAINGAASRGCIICTASIAGIYPFPSAPIYGATKAGVIGLVRSLALPLARHDIQINALAPAVLETNIAPSTLFTNMILTPVETLTRGVEQWVQDRARMGEVAEIHGESVTVRAEAEYVDEDSRKNLEEFWRLGYA